MASQRSELCSRHTVSHTVFTDLQRGNVGPPTANRKTIPSSRPAPLLRRHQACVRSSNEDHPANIGTALATSVSWPLQAGGILEQREDKYRQTDIDFKIYNNNPILPDTSTGRAHGHFSSFHRVRTFVRLTLNTSESKPRAEGERPSENARTIYRKCRFFGDTRSHLRKSKNEE